MSKSKPGGLYEGLLQVGVYQCLRMERLENNIMGKRESALPFSGRR